MVQKISLFVTGVLAAAISTVATAGEPMSTSTRRDLLVAMRDEAFSHLRYKLFAEQARANGNTVLAGMFEKIARDEFNKHFMEQVKLLGLVKSDKENLATAISDEYLETAKMYTDMAKRAEEAGDTKVAQHFSVAAADELEHQKAFRGLISNSVGAAAN